LSTDQLSEQEKAGRAGVEVFLELRELLGGRLSQSDGKKQVL
jgi:hypothetical protein